LKKSRAKFKINLRLAIGLVVGLTAICLGGSTGLAQVIPSPVPSVIGTLPVNPVTLVQVTNASNFTLGNSTVGPQIWGGFVGPISNSADSSLCPTDGSATCNNCVFAPTAPLACNNKRIYGSLQFSISVSVTSTLPTGQGQFFAYMGYTNAAGNIVQFNGAGAGPIAISQNSTVTLTGTWGELCAVLVQSGTMTSEADACQGAAGDSGGDVNITIALSPISSTPFTSNPTTIIASILAPVGDTTGTDGLNIYNPTNDTADVGISSFYAQAGDQEVEINQVVFNGSCPTNAYAAARVYYWQDDGVDGGNSTTLPGFQNASYVPNPGYSQAGLTTPVYYQDMSMNSDCSQNGDWVVTGLTDNVGYFFDISILDSANNNVFLLDPNWIVTQGTCGNFPLTDPNRNPANAGNDAGCAYYAYPSQVEGLLPNELNCFIATAAYGSAFAPAVKTLRAFRDEFLYPFKLGRKFIKFYYRNSPFYAKIIQNNEFLKALARYSLAPLWGFAWLSMYYTPIGVLVMFLSALVFAITASRRYQRGEW
jgi:hypothetical protein